MGELLLLAAIVVDLAVDRSDTTPRCDLKTWAAIRALVSNSAAPETPRAARARCSAEHTRSIHAWHRGTEKGTSISYVTGRNPARRIAREQAR
ncbi:hypothetical protein GGR56DRAFT_660817 [Xylariaceae sp. FL0804]|nr:hypothetical protein GGR56DRAFT_660817 [Xylariaceae sp. FL0804]